MTDEFDDVFGADPKPKMMIAGTDRSKLSEAALAIAREYPEQVIQDSIDQAVPIGIIESIIESDGVSLVSSQEAGYVADPLPEPNKNETPDIYAQRSQYIKTGKGGPDTLPFGQQSVSVDLKVEMNPELEAEISKLKQVPVLEYDMDELANHFQLNEEYHIPEGWYYDKILVVTRITKGEHGGITFTVKNGLPNKWAPEKLCFGWPPVAWYIQNNKFVKRKVSDAAPEKLKRKKKLHGK